MASTIPISQSNPVLFSDSNVSPTNVDVVVEHLINLINLHPTTFVTFLHDAVDARFTEHCLAMLRSNVDLYAMQEYLKLVHRTHVTIHSDNEVLSFTNVLDQLFRQKSLVEILQAALAHCKLIYRYSPNTEYTGWIHLEAALNILLSIKVLTNYSLESIFTLVNRRTDEYVENDTRLVETWIRQLAVMYPETGNESLSNVSPTCQAFELTNQVSDIELVSLFSLQMALVYNSGEAVVVPFPEYDENGIMLNTSKPILTTFDDVIRRNAMNDFLLVNQEDTRPVSEAEHLAIDEIAEDRKKCIQDMSNQWLQKIPCEYTVDTLWQWLAFHLVQVFCQREPTNVRS